MFLLFLFFLPNISHCKDEYQGLTKDVSSTVGAPWRGGVLTISGGIAGIGLGQLFGREHVSTPQSGVEALQRRRVFIHTTTRTNWHVLHKQWHDIQDDSRRQRHWDSTSKWMESENTHCLR